jgi:hypothetical protein
MQAAATVGVYTGPDGRAAVDPSPRTFSYLNKLAMKIIHSDGRFCRILGPGPVADSETRVAFDARSAGTVRYGL